MVVNGWPPVMLNESLPLRPIKARFDSRLVVSNGVGNWFPLRTHAPAEIVHLTLKCQ